MPGRLSSIRTGLIILILLAAIPAIALSLYNAADRRQQDGAAAQREALSLLGLISAEQEQLIAETRGFLHFLSRQSEVRDGDAATCEGYLVDLMAQSHRYGNLGVVDLNGDMYCSAVPLPGPLNLEGSPYIQKARDSGTFAIGEYHIQVATGRPILPTGYPVFDQRGNVKSVVVVALDLGWLSEYVSNTQMLPGSTLTVADQNGLVLARYPDPEVWIGQSVLERPLFQQMSASDSQGTGRAQGLDGVPRLYAFTRLAVPEQPGTMYVSIGIPESVAYVAADRALQRHLLGLGVVLVLTLGIAWFGTDLFMMRRVRALVSATRELSAGNFKARVGSQTGGGEFGILGAAFDHMAQELEDREEERAERIREQARRAEAEAGRERISRILESINDAFFAVDREWRFTYLNSRAEQAMQRLTGKRSGELIGQEMWQEMAHAMDTHILEECRRAVDQQVSVQFEAFCPELAAWLEVRAHPSADGLSISFQDITERKHAEEALRASEAQLAEELSATQQLQTLSTQLIQENNVEDLYQRILDVGVTLMNSDMASIQLLDEGENALRLIGWVGFAPESAEFWELVRCNSDSRSTCGTALQAGERVVITDIDTCDLIIGTPDHEAYRKSGIRAVQSTPLVSRSGRVLGVVSTHWREPHQPSERDFRLLDVLARQAADLLERAQHEEALREADRRKDQFLAMLSHELRNPLSPIVGGLEFLRRSRGVEPPPQEVEILDLMDRQVGNLTRLVDDLLDVSRVTTGRIQLQQRDIDLNTLVQSTADSLRPQMTERHHLLSVDLVDHPLWVHGDPTRLEQVVVNLLSNAAKYTPPGGWIWLSTWAEGREAMIRVKDSGIGMEPELVPHIFELFTQGGRELDRSKGGLGIGLTLVKSLVEMHGGTVTAASDGPGKGSEFVVSLPLTAAPALEVASPPEESANGAKTSLRVLLAEDVEDARKVFAMLLTDMHHEVLTAHDGPNTVAAALKYHPDVVLLDIGLPGLDGYEVARRIRQEPALRGTVLVAVTGYGQPSDRKRAQEAGIDYHLVKPPDIGKLEQILAEIAGSRTGGR